MIRYFWAGYSTVLLAVMLAAAEADLQWSVVLILWANMLFYAVSRLKYRAFFAAFLVAFFVFLMGRETLVHVLGYRQQRFDSAVDAHVHWVLGVGLSVSWLAYHLWTRRQWRFGGGRGPQPHLSGQADDPSARSRANGIRHASLITFYLTVAPAYYAAISRAGKVAAEGYSSLYTPSSTSADDSIVDMLAAQLSLVNVVGLAVFLATMPPPKSARVPMILWGGYLALTLASGQRGSFITGLFLLVCYSVVRMRITPDERWLTRRSVLLLVTATPVLVALLVAVETARGVGGEYQGGFGTVVLEFFYTQGVSSTVIANGYMFRDLVPIQNYLVEFLHSGIPARVLGIQVLQGNTIAHATAGGSYTHALGFAVLGEMYLNGRGTGSSYLAEAYQTFQWSGIVSIATIYGMLLGFLDGMAPHAVFGNSVRLIIAQDIFWAPRGSASGFLSTILAPSVVFTVALVLIGGWAASRMSERKTRHVRMAASKRRWVRAP